ncbi:AlwI family type II restriction endonuclease [Enterococcus faecium]|nr:AlwI family type II restriction endonuclease [Enterococcus faecium]
MGSKRHDVIGEYSDTFFRLLSVTGIVSMKNGIATLKYRDLWLNFFELAKIEDTIFGEATKKKYEAYEKNSDSSFYSHVSIEEIFGIDNTASETIVKEISEDLHVSTADEARNTLKSKVNNEFVAYIKENYPKERIIDLLDLFSNRNNDQRIQEEVGSTASVPTIFEYIVGIAWYHISEKEYDVFSSFNLTMSADFIPETHAGGGGGDIVINYHDKVVMLEVTLMNKQAQKRGEWEPVLRHATNLTIEEAPKEVVTLFIADELDDNTINIWRAIASVPLKSSREVETGGRYAENVTIMPLQNSELSMIIEKGMKEEELLDKIKYSFGQLALDFDLEWRDKIMSVM